MQFTFNDGGRRGAGYKGQAGDCVTRAIAIATGLPYSRVYDDLFEGIRSYGENHRSRVARRIQAGGGKRGTTPRNGIHKNIYKPYLERLGWKWVPTMRIGSGCTVHLRAEELPKGKIIVSVSKHMVAVIDGVIHDTHDCSREGTRCVYGYFVKN